MALVVGLLVLGALAVPAGAQFYQNSWGYSYPYGGSYGLDGLGGLGGLSGIYGPFGPFGMMGMGGLGGLGGLGGYSPYSYNNGLGSSPYSSYSSYPSSSLLSSSPSTDLFSTFGSDSPFANLFGGSLFKAKTYGPPPTSNITNALVGQKLSYNSGYMGIPLQYQIEKSDIGDITGTQYRGADAWKVRVGQEGAYWDVTMDATGNKVLGATQVQ